jgi:hypothetical protein
LSSSGSFNCRQPGDLIVAEQISPILANLYLHYVLDLWAEAWRKKLARGEVMIVRYADDGAPRAQRAEEGPMCVTA